MQKNTEPTIFNFLFEKTLNDCIDKFGVITISYLLCINGFASSNIFAYDHLQEVKESNYDERKISLFSKLNTLAHFVPPAPSIKQRFLKHYLQQEIKIYSFNKEKFNKFFCEDIVNSLVDERETVKDERNLFNQMYHYNQTLCGLINCIS